VQRVRECEELKWGTQRWKRFLPLLLLTGASEVGVSISSLLLDPADVVPHRSGSCTNGFVRKTPILSASQHSRRTKPLRLSATFSSRRPKRATTFLSFLLRNSSVTTASRRKTQRYASSSSSYQTELTSSLYRVSSISSLRITPKAYQKSIETRCCAEFAPPSTATTPTSSLTPPELNKPEA
jgi:hypothetical protein